MAPTGQGGQWQDVLCCSLCGQHFDQSFLPVSLICGHVFCRICAKLSKTHEKPCPNDDWKPTKPLEEYPTNVALLSIARQNEDCTRYSDASTDTEKSIDKAMCGIAAYFQRAESERGGSVFSEKLSKTLQRKVVSLLCYQWAEPDGRVKIVKACRAICERIMTEILLSIQSYTHVSGQLWSAVRARGCQFLGPAMQEDVLRLILMTLENGADIARKNLVMYVVKTLEPDYPQVSKTCVGHVVQLLYRASCFNVIKRDGESSLMQLKEEYRTYESLRREHDSQIVQIAFEAGLRIGPEQWSALLYADQGHKSHMQSIIDKLQSPNSYSQCLEELGAPLTMQRSESKNVISEMLEILRVFEKVPTESIQLEQISDHLTKLLKLLDLYTETEGKQLGVCYQPPNVEQNEKKRFYGAYRYKTRMCMNMERSGCCDKGDQCTYAHSAEELREHTQNGGSNRKGEGSSRDSPRKSQQEGMRGYPRGRPNPRAPAFVPAAQRRPSNGAMQQFYRNMRPARMVVPPPPPGTMIVGYPDMVPAAGAGASHPTTNGSAPPPPSQPVMIMQSPTHLPMMMATQSAAPTNAPTVWAAQSPTGAPANIIYPGASPSSQNPHTIWIPSAQSSVFPMESYDFGLGGGMIWGATNHLRESGADAEQLLAKRNEILHRLQPPMSQDDDDCEDGGIGHVSYTVASSVLDDSRIEVYPIAMRPPIEIPAMPVAYSTVPQTEEALSAMGEIVQNRSRAPSLTQPNGIIAPAGQPPQVGGVITATMATECGTVSVIDSVGQPIVTSCIQPPCDQMPIGTMVTAIAAVPPVCTEGFVTSVAAPPPPAAAAAPVQPLIVDGATGLLAPMMHPILVTPAFSQELVSNSLDKIVDVKERLNEAQGNVSEAENAHLRMELRMAECEMAHLDPFTKNNCLLRELHQVDLELQQLQIEPTRNQ